LPASYYFIWLFFKLPILALIGILLFPFVEKKIFNNTAASMYYLTLLLSFFLILFIFILKSVAVYDELRHVLFLVPMIFLIGLTNLFYFNKKLFISLGSIVIFFFLMENFSLYPYQYTWLNSFAKFTNIQKNFEIDYWGISNKNLTKKIVQYSEENSISKDTCVYGDIFAKEYLTTKNFTCFKTYSKLDAAKEKTLFAYKNLRNVKRSDPKDCKLILNETYNYSFYKKKISVGTLWFCS
jgi:disulfide oxidoreductase YuzD